MKLILYKRRGTAAKEVIRLYCSSNEIYKYYGLDEERGCYYFLPKDKHVFKPTIESEHAKFTLDMENKNIPPEICNHNYALLLYEDMVNFIESLG